MAGNVIATIMRSKMQNRSGYLSINELMDEMTMYYTFKHCIKIHEQDSFVNWICYWEDSPIAVKCIVSASVLANGFTKVAIISKEIIDVDKVGEYKSNKNYMLGYIMKDTGFFVEEHSTQQYINKTINSEMHVTNPSTVQTTIAKSENKSKVLSQAEIDKFKEIMQNNWGCTFKN